MSWKIVRFFEDIEIGEKVVETGLSFDEVKEHCNDPESSSSTCTDQVGLDRTAKLGSWFDGWREE